MRFASGPGEGWARSLTDLKYLREIAAAIVRIEANQLEILRRLDGRAREQQAGGPFECAVRRVMADEAFTASELKKRATVSAELARAMADSGVRSVCEIGRRLARIPEIQRTKDRRWKFPAATSVTNTDKTRSRETLEP